MKAIVCTRYGPPEVLELREVEKPSPQKKEILVRIRASSVTAADTMMRKGTPFYGRFFLGLTKPKNPIPGTGFAGVIEELGDDVQRFRIGDRVFGETGINFGANAEYLCISEEAGVMATPSILSDEEAAPICDGALTSYSFLKDIAGIQNGWMVLVNGASGSLGSAAVQIANHFGAEVTAICGPSNQEWVRTLGADQVIDYTKDDFRKTGKRFNIVFDTVGKSSFSECKSLLTDNGVYLSPVLNLSILFQMLTTSFFGSKKAKFSATGLRPVKDLRVLLEELVALFEEGEIKTVIDRRFSLEEAVSAHRYVDAGHKKGNVVLVPN